MNKFQSTTKIRYLILICFLISCTPPQLLIKLNQRHHSDIQGYFGVITTATKEHVDSLVKISGRDSTIEKFNSDGWYFYRVGDFGRSISSFNRVLYLDSANPNPYWAYGLTLSFRCEMDSAITFLSKAISLDSTEVRLRCDLAYSLAVRASKIADPIERESEYLRVISEYQKQIVNFNKFPIIRLQFAEVLMATGDSIGAVEHLKIAKKEKHAVANAERILKHILNGGTLYSYICK